MTSSPKSAEQVAAEAAKMHGYCCGDVINLIAEDLEQIISADRAARAAGYTPGTPPPFETEILVETAGGRRYIAWFKDAAEWDAIKHTIRRWWELPGTGGPVPAPCEPVHLSIGNNVPACGAKGIVTSVIGGDSLVTCGMCLEIMRKAQDIRNLMAKPPEQRADGQRETTKEKP